jgi:hypothetical protein
MRMVQDKAALSESASLSASQEIPHLIAWREAVVGRQGTRKLLDVMGFDPRPEVWHKGEGKSFRMQCPVAISEQPESNVPRKSCDPSYVSVSVPCDHPEASVRALKVTLLNRRPKRKTLVLKSRERSLRIADPRAR